MKKTGKIWLVVLMVPVLAIAGFLLFAYADSKSYWKITDPADPAFNIETFAFNDYGSHDELAEALKILVPPGTPFEVADKIMRGPKGRGGKDITKNKKSIIDGLRLRQKVNPSSVRIDLNVLEQKTEKVRFYADGGRWKLMWPEFGWLVEVFYDDEDRVVQIVSGGIVLFEEGKIQ